MRNKLLYLSLAVIALLLIAIQLMTPAPMLHVRNHEMRIVTAVYRTPILDLLKAYKYDPSASLDWFQEIKSPYDVAQEQVAVSLFSFKETSIPTDSILRFFDENGLQPATAWDVVTVDFIDPLTDKEYCIIALGTQADNNPYRYARLIHSGSHKHAQMALDPSTMPPDCVNYFAAVPKKVKTGLVG